MSNVMKQKDIKNQIELMEEVKKYGMKSTKKKLINAIDSMPSIIRDWLKQNEEHINY